MPIDVEGGELGLRRSRTTRTGERPSRKKGLLDLEPARKELLEKDILDIERATAITWGGRAAAAYELATQEGDDALRLGRLQDAENYRQEAIEHAAMTEDFEFLAQVRNEIDQYRRVAVKLGA